MYVWGEVDYNRTYNDGSGLVLRWEPIAVDVQGGVHAPTPVRMPQTAAASSYNRTVAFVLCTHVYVPPTRRDDSNISTTAVGSNNNISETGSAHDMVEVTLTGSTSAIAEISLGDSRILSDRLITGRMIGEFSRKVSLVPGRWTALRIKAMQMSWSAPWEMSLSIHGEGMKMIPGLQSRY